MIQQSLHTITGASASYYNSLNWTMEPPTSGTLTGITSLNPTFIPASGFTGKVTLTLTVAGNSACANMTASDQMELIVNKSVIAFAGEDQLIQEGATAILSGSASEGSGFYAWNWQPESLLDNNTVMNPVTLPLTTPTSFVLTILDLSTGCTDSDTMNITLEAANIGPIAVEDFDTTLVNRSVTLDVLSNDINPGGGPLTITFCDYPDHGIVVLNSDSTITYTPYEGYEGDDSFCYQICDNGDPVHCASNTVHIKVKPASIDDIFIYNGITPNSDGTNEVWIIRGIENYPDNTVLIFNRWGDKIREFDSYDNKQQSWDGTNDQNKKVPDGTYFYILEIKNVGTRTGWIFVRGNNVNN